MEYELSKYIILSKQNEIYKIQYQTINKELVINESIFIFLEKINKLNTIENILASFPFETEAIKDNINKLLNYFIDLGVIVRKGQEGIAIDYNIKFTNNFEIDDYTIIQTISNRKSGELYKVIDKHNNKYVLKTLIIRKFPNIKIYKKALIAFEKENSYGSLMNNNNLCEIYKGVFEKEWGAYYLMEFIDGESLLNFNNSKKYAIKNIFTQILEGFNYIHEKEMLHGDIHLNNILINNELKIKIIDYGLTSDLSSNESYNGGVCEFIPPERMSSDIIKKFINKNTIRAEIYQLGLIYYYILTNKLPYKSNTWRNIYMEKINFKITDLEEYNSFSNLDKKIILKCLAPNPDDRFSSIQQLIEIL